MKFSKPVAIYCEHIPTVLNKTFEIKYCLYDRINSIKNDLPKIHYTQISNLGITIIINQISTAKKLINRGNAIYYYMNKTPEHDINYKTMDKLMGSIDGILLDRDIPQDVIKKIFNFNGEIMYV